MSETLFSDVVGSFKTINNLVFLPEIDSLENLENIDEAKSRVYITSSIVLSNKSLFVPGSILDRKYIFFMSDCGYFDKRRVLPEKLSSLTVFQYHGVELLVLYKHELDYVVKKIDVLKKAEYLKNIHHDFICIYDISNDKEMNKATSCLNRVFPERDVSLFIGDDYSYCKAGDRYA